MDWIKNSLFALTPLKRNQENHNRNKRRFVVDERDHHESVSDQPLTTPSESQQVNQVDVPIASSQPIPPVATTTASATTTMSAPSTPFFTFSHSTPMFHSQFTPVQGRSISPDMTPSDRLKEFLSSRQGQSLTPEDIQKAAELVEHSQFFGATSSQVSSSGSLRMEPPRPLFTPVKTFSNHGSVRAPSTTSSTTTSFSRIKISRKPVQYLGSGVGSSYRRSSNLSQRFGSSRFSKPMSYTGTVSGSFMRPVAARPIPTQPVISTLNTKRVKLSGADEAMARFKSLSEQIYDTEMKLDDPSNSFATTSRVNETKKESVKVSGAAAAILETLEEMAPPTTSILAPFSTFKPLSNPYQFKGHTQPALPRSQPQTPDIPTLKSRQINESAPVEREKAAPQPPSQPFKFAPTTTASASKSLFSTSQASPPRNAFTIPSPKKTSAIPSSITTSTNKPLVDLTISKIPSQNSQITLPSPLAQLPPAPAPAPSVPLFTPTLPSFSRDDSMQIDYVNMEEPVTVESILNEVKSVPKEKLPSFEWRSVQLASSSFSKKFSDLGVDVVAIVNAPSSTLPTVQWGQASSANTGFNWSQAGFSKPTSAPGSWDCPVCMIKNKPEAAKCISCETDKPGAATKSTVSVPASNGFKWSEAGFSKPAATPGSWDCPVCMIKNKPDSKKCVSCETDKPAPAPTSTAPVTSGSSGFNWAAATGSSAPVKKSGWTCSTCMISNKEDASICAACESPR